MKKKGGMYADESNCECWAWEKNKYIFLYLLLWINIDFRLLNTIRLCEIKLYFFFLYTFSLIQSRAL